jgi:hypothetical protein
VSSLNDSGGLYADSSGVIKARGNGEEGSGLHASSSGVSPFMAM